MDKVDGYDAADLRVLLDRAALSAARRALEQPAVAEPANGDVKRLQMNTPLANGHSPTPAAAFPAILGAN